MNRLIYCTALLFFLLDYVRPGNYVPPLNALHLNSLVPLIAILGTIIWKTPVSNEEFLSQKNTRLMGVLLGLLVFSTLFATVTDFAFTVTKNVFSYMLVYWVLVRQIGDYQRLKWLFLTLTLVHLIVAGLNPALFTNPDSRVGINSGGFLGDGNDFSLSVNICVPLLLFVLLEAKSKIAKFALALGLLTLMMAVVATKSRGGTLAFAAVMLYFWWGSQRKAMMAALFTLVLAIVLAMAPASYFERMGTMADTEEGSSAGRIEAWKEGVKMAARNPLMGAGAGHFPLAFGTATEGRWKTAHSIYFLLLGELGIPGIAVLLTFIFSNILANRRLQVEILKLPPEQASTARNVLNCTSAALVAYAVGGAFLSAAYYPHMYVLSGMLVAGRFVVGRQLATLENPGHDAVKVPPVKRRITAGAISPEWVPRAQLRARTDLD
jgi:putative inorganic carbon (HCO3(-)) transporter